MAGDMIDELVVGVRFAVNEGSEKKATKAVSALQAEIDRLTASFPKQGEWEDTLDLPEPDLTPWENFAALMVTAGVATVGLGISAAMAGDQAHDMGVAMNLSAEDVQTLGYAANAADVSMETLGGGLGSLQKLMKAAAGGSKEAQEAFQKLGVDPSKYENSAEAIGDVSDAFGRLKSDADKTNLAIELFGGNGPAMRDFLALGSDGIDDLTERARALGFVISDDDAKIGGHLLDTLGDLGKISTGVGRKIGLALVPALDEAATSTVDWYVANHDIIDQQLDRVTDGISKALEYMLTPLGLATTGALGLAAAWGAAGAAKAMAGAVAEASPLAAALGGQAKNAIAATAALGPYAIGVAAVALTLDDLNKASEGVDSITLRLAKTIGVEGETQAALKSMKTLLSETAGLAWDLEVAFNKGIGDAIDGLAAKLPEIKPLLDAIKEVLSFGVGDALTAVAGAAQSGISTVTEARSDLAQGNYVKAGADLVRGFSPGYDVGASYRESGGTSVTVGGVVIQIADPAAAAREAGAALERQVLDALATLPGN